MDTTVWIMVVSIYASAFLAPLAVFAAARRTGHGAAWQGVAAGCGILIWSALALGFAQQFLALTFFDGFLERFGFVAVVALAVISAMGFWLAVKSWPSES